MKNPFEKLWKTTEKPKEKVSQHPYRSGLSEKEREIVDNQDKENNARWFKKMLRAIDRYELDPDPETTLRIQALGARLLQEDLPPGSPEESVLDQWLTELHPYQKMSVIHEMLGSPNAFIPMKRIQWNEQKYGPIRDKIMDEIEIGKKKRK